MKQIWVNKKVQFKSWVRNDEFRIDKKPPEPKITGTMIMSSGCCAMIPFCIYEGKIVGRYTTERISYGKRRKIIIEKKVVYTVLVKNKNQYTTFEVDSNLIIKGFRKGESQKTYLKRIKKSYI